MARPPQSAIVDPKTGQVTPEWLNFLSRDPGDISSGGGITIIKGGGGTSGGSGGGSLFLDAANLTGDTLAANVLHSSLTSVGVLTLGSLGPGFVIDLNSVSTIGSIPWTALPAGAGSWSAGLVEVTGTVKAQQFIGNGSGLTNLSLAAHALTHQAGGADAIKLDALAAPDDVIALNATTSKHGLLPKLSGAATQFLNGLGAWTEPASSGAGALAPHASTHMPGGTDVLTVSATARVLGRVSAGAGPVEELTYINLPGRISAGTELRLSDNSYSRVATVDSGGSWGGGYNFNWNNAFPIYDSTGPIVGTGNNSGWFRVFVGASQPAGTAAPERLRLTATAMVLTASDLSVIGATYAAIHLTDNSAGTDLKPWQIRASAGDLIIRSMNDTEATTVASLTIAHTGDVTLPANANLYWKSTNSTKYIGEVKASADQFIFGNNLYWNGTQWTLLDTSKAGAIMRATQAYWDVEFSAAGANPRTPVSPIVADITGAYFPLGLSERGRAFKSGEYVDVPYLASNFSADSGATWSVTAGNISSNRYTVIGKTLIWSFYISASTLTGAPGALLIRLPYGSSLLPYTGFFAVGYCSNQTGEVRTRGASTSDGAYVAIYITPFVAWPAGNVAIQLTAVIPLQ